jgi:hypothetical protein
MKNLASMRPDLLLITTQGVKGKKYHSNLQGSCRMKVSKGYNEPEDSICLDVFEGFGNTYNHAETAKINICFSDGKEWNGNFEKLQKALNL